jgi:group II intron reverse transcriptase/maturase
MLLRRLVSESNLKSAWVRVRDNHGCAGVDGVSIEEFGLALSGRLDHLAKEIWQSSYRPLPLLKIIVDKGNGEGRGLSIPTVRDRVAQAAALNVLEPLFEAEFEHCSFAYRKGRSWQQAVHQVKEYYEQGYRWVLDADIDAFFDSVPHGRLLDKVERLVVDQELRRLIRLWVEAEVWDGETVTRLTKGIPQGSVISPILANLYLDELDEELLAQGIRLVRYADDFLVLCKTEDKAKAAQQLTEEILRQMGLELDEADVVHFDQGFRFLGVVFCRSTIMVPFDREKKPKQVLYMPPSLNLKAYRAGLLTAR